MELSHFHIEAILHFRFNSFTKKHRIGNSITINKAIITNFIESFETFIAWRSLKWKNMIECRNY